MRKGILYYKGLTKWAYPVHEHLKKKLSNRKTDTNPLLKVMFLIRKINHATLELLFFIDVTFQKTH